MDNNELIKFQRALMDNGIIGYSHSDLQHLYSVAKACAKTNGITGAGVGAVGLAAAGSVTIPGIGAVPGFVAGALAGFVGGTVTCMIIEGSLKKQLDEIIRMK